MLCLFALTADPEQESSTAFFFSHEEHPCGMFRIQDILVSVVIFKENVN